MTIKKFALLKWAFWIIIFLTAISTISIIYCNHKGLIMSNETDATFSDTIFSNGLSLIFSIIGFLVALILFLVQYIGTKFDSHELEKSPTSNKLHI